MCKVLRPEYTEYRIYRLCKVLTPTLLLLTPAPQLPIPGRVFPCLHHLGLACLHHTYAASFLKFNLNTLSEKFKPT